jgi:hypothetical protein
MNHASLFWGEIVGIVIDFLKAKEKRLKLGKISKEKDKRIHTKEVAQLEKLAFFIIENVTQILNLLGNY